MGGRRAHVSKAIDPPPSPTPVPPLTGRVRPRRRARRPESRRRDRQRLLAFLARAERRDRGFKVAIAGFTVALMILLVATLPTGRYAVDWLMTRGRWLALRSVGIEPDRSEIDADWSRKRG